jgi:hypothetical protein
MNLSQRLKKIETIVGNQMADDDRKQQIRELRHANLTTGLGRFGFDEESARRYAELSCEGVEKYGPGGFKIIDSEIVPVES